MDVDNETAKEPKTPALITPRPVARLAAKEGRRCSRDGEDIQVCDNFTMPDEMDDCETGAKRGGLAHGNLGKMVGDVAIWKRRGRRSGQGESDQVG